MSAVDILGWYASLPYPPPIGESLPVVRIPITGPAPCNTLVVVRSAISVTPLENSTGQIQRYRFTGSTPFQLIGHDPRTKPVLGGHSTTAALQVVQLENDTTFLYAVDSVSGEFSDDGTWQVTFDVASSVDHELGQAAAYVSSWVACWEKPVDESQPSAGVGQQGRLRRADPEMHLARMPSREARPPRSKSLLEKDRQDCFPRPDAA